MANIRQEFDYKLINLISQQLAQIQKLHGYTVEKLTLTRDIDGDYDFQIESEVVSDV